jgi:hypothetical protein
VGVVLLCECFGVVCDVTLVIVALVVGDCMRALFHGAVGFWLHFWSVSGLGWVGLSWCLVHLFIFNVRGLVVVDCMDGKG